MQSNTFDPTCDPINTMGMSYLKVINASRASIHKYENLRGNCTIAMQIFISTNNVLENNSHIRQLYSCNENIYFQSTMP